jgi:tetraacyldisaccharide 4'-kinase
MLYALAVWLRNLFFEIGLLPVSDIGVPVISIGNITAGGTGKTPMTANVVKILQNAGKRPAVISRGYGRVSGGTVIACDGKSIQASPLMAGDEPVLLARMTDNAIVVADEDRVRGARTAVKQYGADVIVLDDGFQHRYLHRTKDIVLVDTHQLPFSTMLIPAGYRREPMGSLKRATAVMVTKAGSASEAATVMQDERMGYGGRTFSSEFTPVGIKHVFGGVGQSLEILKGHSAVVFCGIAGPEAFLKHLNECGITVREQFIFPDHHRFTDAEIAEIVASFHAAKADFILTTEKDAVRLGEFESRLVTLPVSALVMELVIHQQEAWRTYILDGIVS